MKKWLCLAPMVLCLNAQAQNEDDAAKKDLKAFQGTWFMAALEVNGKDVPLEKLGNTLLIIQDNLYSVKIKDKVHAVRIQLDPGKNPKELDMIFLEGEKKDQVGKAIYLLEKDTLKLARGLDPRQDRPREFATWPDTDYFVVTWKRKP